MYEQNSDEYFSIIICDHYKFQQPTDLFICVTRFILYCLIKLNGTNNLFYVSLRILLQPFKFNEANNKQRSAVEKIIIAGKFFNHCGKRIR